MRARIRAHCIPFDRAFCARSIPHASFAPRRSLLCEFVEPDHHAGGFQYLLLELRTLVLFVFSGSCAVQPVFVAARVGSRSRRVDPWAIRAM